MTLMDLVDEDDGPVVLGRRRSRHGNYYEEIPPEPEPTPVPVHVPEPLAVGEWGANETALDYIKALETANYPTYTATWSPINGAPNQWSSTGMGSTGSYSISLNDVIGSYKGTTALDNYYLKSPPEAKCNHKNLTYMMDTMVHRCNSCGVGVTDEFLKQSLPTKCAHQRTEPNGNPKFKFNKSKPGGTSTTPVRCVDCGHAFIRNAKF